MTEYILKPVNVDELTEILKKVRSKLDEEIESARNIDSLRESYKTSLPVLKILLMPPVSRGNKGIFVKREFLSDTFKECDKENTHARVEMLLCGCFLIVLYPTCIRC